MTNGGERPIADLHQSYKVALMKLPPKTLQSKEQLLFVCLIAWLGIAGLLYERFRYSLPAWQSIGAVMAFMAFGYVTYFVALRALRR